MYNTAMTKQPNKTNPDKTNKKAATKNDLVTPSTVIKLVLPWDKVKPVCQKIIKNQAKNLKIDGFFSHGFFLYKMHFIASPIGLACDIKC